MDMLYRSCSVFHQESNKLSLHFSDFLMIFYAFYKIQQFGNTMEDVVLRGDPWKFLQFHNHALALYLRP
jgi:hypothetical protein